MAKDFVITCPHCSKTFSAQDFIKDHLAEAKKESIENQKKFKAGYEKKLKAQQRSKKEEVAEVQKKMQAKLKRREVEIQAQANTKAKAELNKKVKERMETEKKKIESNAFEKANKTKEKEINAAKKAAKLDVIKKDKEIAIIKVKAEKDIENTRRATNKQLEDMKKKMSQDPSERKGKIQEQILVDFLRENFPKDKIIPIPKGAKGADCIHQINEKDHPNIGRIYYESKDTKEFSETWVKKLLDDMTEKDINFGIIVTETMPKTSKGKVEYRHNDRIAICPMNWEVLFAQANSYRQMSIKFKKYVGKNTPDDIGKDDLWDTFKTGSSYKLITRLNDSYIEEVKQFDSHEKSLKKLRKNSQDRRDAFLELLANLKSIPDLYPENFLEDDN